MELLTSQSGEGEFAVSFVPNSGEVAFTIVTPCAASVAIWGRVIDFRDGVNDGDPDSFDAAIDGGARLPWFYGCSTFDTPDSVWQWVRLAVVETGTTCGDAVALEPTWDGGPHVVSLRNREAGNPSTPFAGVARLLVTNDLQYVPTDAD
jgi:hypothetical protein